MNTPHKDMRNDPAKSTCLNEYSTFPFSPRIKFYFY